MIRKDTRSLHVFGQEWEYKIGKKHVAIYGPEKVRHYPRFEEVTGDVNSDASLNPQVIKNYIEVTILKSEPTARKCSRCKEVKSDVSMRVNPFQAEIHDDFSKRLYCDECIGDLAEEI